MTLVVSLSVICVFERIEAPVRKTIDGSIYDLQEAGFDVSDKLGHDYAARAHSKSFVKKPTHRVQHIELLNNWTFWWLIGAFVLSVGALVVTSEMKPVSYFQKSMGSKSPPAPQHHVPADRDGSPKLRSASKASNQAAGVQRTSQMASYLGTWLYCFAGLTISLLLCGISQEFVMTHEYTSADDAAHDDGPGGTRSGDHIPSVLFVVLLNRLASALFSGLVVLAHGSWSPLCSQTGYVVLGSQAAASNVLALWCQHQSLAFVPFTVLATVHSARLLPVQILSSLRGERHSLVDYAETTVIVLAVIVFGLETHRHERLHETPGIGVALLLAMLVFDSLTPHFQEVLFSAHPEVTVMQHMLVMSVVAAVAIAAALCASGTLIPCLAFLLNHPESLVHLSVLAASSTLAQYYIMFSIQQFGPLFFALVSSVRQVVTVSASVFLFQHLMSSLAGIATVIIVSIILLRVLRLQLMGPTASILSPRLNQRAWPKLAAFIPLFICAAGIHVIHCFYAVVQEFLAVHTFKGELFAFPVFNVLVNHSLGAFLAYCVLKFKGLAAFPRGGKLTVFPAMSNFTGTFCQHKALYAISFPTQTLMKTLKVVPVMLVGRLLKNRRYSWLDYLDSMVITFIVAYFVWDFQMHGLSSSGESSAAEEEEVARGTQGILLMVGYLLSDSLTSNLQDHVYQTAHLDPSQMLFALEVISSSIAFFTMVSNGQAVEVLSFIARHPQSMLYVLLLAFTSACGAYVCTVTVSLFGPAVFTLLMVSRQVASLVISVCIFGHKVDLVQCLCLVTVSFVILTSSMRRVGAQLASSQS